MGSASLLIIEGKRADYTAFTPALRRKGFEVELVLNGSEALKTLQDGYEPDAIIVSAASLGSSGKRICQALHEQANKIPVVLILESGVDHAMDQAEVVLTLPFTVQKLVNRLKHVLPFESDKMLHIGPIRLDLEQRNVSCLGKKTRLTPRLVTLLTILIQRHGEVLERKKLFSQVWETDYTEDTRTLDVHISWLRKAIEVDPNHPRFIKTTRGLGYQLDL